MRRLMFQAPQLSPEQASQHSPDQAPRRTPDQAPRRTPDQAPRRSPDRALHQTQQSTPDLTLHNTPENTPHNNPDESSLIANNDDWELGTMHTDGRLRVGVINGMLEASCKCSHQITSIMHERLEPTGFTWKKVSRDTKEFYFEEFKKWFVWKLPDNIMYKAFLKNAAIRYKDLRSRARAHWETKPPELNNRIGKDVWLSWIEDWKTPEWQEKSKKKRQNRRGGVDHGDYPATHTGGSASGRTHTARLAEKWKRKPSPTEVFEHLHTKNNDGVTYICKKDAAVAETIKTLRAERSRPVDGSTVDQPVDEIMLYYDAIGGRNKKNRIYGIGSSHDIFYEPNGNTSSHFSSLTPDTQKFQKLETELQEMKEQIKEMDKVKQRMREMEGLVARLLDSQNQ